MVRGEPGHVVPLSRAGRFPVLDTAQLEVLRTYGTEHEVAAGDVLFAEGDETYDLIVVLDGEIEIIENRGRPAESVIATYGPRQFIGEISLLLDALGMSDTNRNGASSTCDLLVVGGGPSGLSAAVYGASEGMAIVLAEDTAFGGQAGTSSRIENYLGFPAGLSGEGLAARAVLQAQKFRVRMKLAATAVALESDAGLHRVTFGDGDVVAATALIIATGASYNRLSVNRLAEFEGVGVYYAATQMEAQACGAGPVAIVGGGNSASPAQTYRLRSATPADRRLCSSKPAGRGSSVSGMCAVGPSSALPRRSAKDPWRSASCLNGSRPPGLRLRTLPELHSNTGQNRGRPAASSILTGQIESLCLSSCYGGDGWLFGSLKVELYGGADDEIRLYNCPFRPRSTEYRDVVRGMNLSIMQGVKETGHGCDTGNR